MRRIKRTKPSAALIVAVVALVAALAGTAVGGVAVTSLNKKETKKVRKIARNQANKAMKGIPAGPEGPQGLQGPQGEEGDPGTARAYARVTPDSQSPCEPDCTFDRSKGITSVTYQGGGEYCVTATGIDPASVPAAVTVDWPTTGVLNPIVQVDQTGLICDSDEFGVQALNLPQTNVRNEADNSSVNVSGNQVTSSNVGFTILIP